MVYGNFEKRRKVHEALDELVSASGTKFDFELVNVFIRSVAPYPTGSLVSLNNGEFGMVLRQNVDTPTRPLIRIVQQNENDEWIRKEEKDLSEELALFIVDTIE